MVDITGSQNTVIEYSNSSKPGNQLKRGFSTDYLLLFQAVSQSQEISLKV